MGKASRAKAERELLREYELTARELAAGHAYLREHMAELEARMMQYAGASTVATALETLRAKHPHLGSKSIRPVNGGLPSLGRRH